MNATLPGRSLSTGGAAGGSSEVWLAGIQRYRASPDAGVLLSLPLPVDVRYGTQQHQLVVEWVGVTATEVSSRILSAWLAVGQAAGH
jgi:hypothetical protein